VIVPDLNLLVYAHNEAASQHLPAKAWWEACLSGTESVGLSWLTVIGFVRLAGSRQVLVQPLPPATSLRLVRSWFDHPPVALLNPGARHLDVLEGLLGASGMTGSAATDAHLAALAIEHQAELHSNDVDFSRFPGLRWRNPIRE
jgi:toxin-antitoxin system PIN domain toxin